MRSFFEVTAVCVKKMDADPVQDCGFCGASASVFCSECGETYCQACSERRHSRAGKKDHEVQQLKRTTADAQSISELVNDADKEGNFYLAPSLTPYILYRLSFSCVERRLRWIGILAQHFQLTSLHGWQEKVIAAVLDGRNSVVIQPTGSGKSLCFQLPPFLCEGKMAVVITPTISLMVDQATSLSDAGIPATYLGSAQSDKTIPQ